MCKLILCRLSQYLEHLPLIRAHHGDRWMLGWFWNSLSNGAKQEDIAIIITKRKESLEQLAFIRLIQNIHLIDSHNVKAGKMNKGILQDNPYSIAL